MSLEVSALFGQLRANSLSSQQVLLKLSLSSMALLCSGACESTERVQR